MELPTAVLTIIALIRLGLRAYMFMILASVLLSWFTFGGSEHPSVLRAQEFLARFTEPFLGPLRQMLMPLSQRIGLDFSPLIGIFILQFIGGMLPG